MTNLLSGISLGHRNLLEIQKFIFIGPTGCGKTGLGTAFLIHAINQGYRGYFIEFSELIHQLFQSKADHSEHKILKRFQSYEILLIDELGYDPLEKEQAGLFFELIKGRNGRYATILTTQLGFEEWGDFLHNEHLRAALIDRITVNCTLFTGCPKSLSIFTTFTASLLLFRDSAVLTTSKTQ